MSLTSQEHSAAVEFKAHMILALEANVDLYERAEFFNALFSGPGSAVDKHQSKMRTENYREATDDLPMWALRIAKQRWNRGEVTPGENGGRVPNFDFAPSPASLRTISLAIIAPYRQQMRDIEDLMSAKPLLEILGEQNGKSEKVVQGFEKLSATLGSVVDRAKPQPLDVEAVRAAGRTSPVTQDEMHDCYQGGKVD